MKASEKWGHVVDLTDSSSGPVVFHFRSTKYLKVAPEHLKDWEALTLKNCGHLPDLSILKTGRPSWHPTATISGSYDGLVDSYYW
ncbi:hypothetical protein [Alloacidobacterium sp.]|uniref:hypothetical protein n=1 Tax=Alloacidobacterium sp. TaxID=2951999 RepID=UPI002D40326F|nr:hypothetical protein [Alloacidobacterium sp.]HYK34440.1 hypothetical protein [Alloacidobacterium sp.]